jgi:Fe-S cluster assembly protein SufD
MNALGQTNSADPFLARYQGLAGGLPGPRAPREAAAALLRRAGLPGPRDEAWKYTSLRPLGEVSFHTALTDAGDHPAPLALPYLGALADEPRLVFVAGRYRSDLSVLPQYVTARRFAGHLCEPGAGAAPDQDRLIALNTLLAEDGALLEVAAGTNAGMLLLIHMSADLSGTPTSFHPRHELLVRAGAALTLVEISAGTGTYLHNPVIDIELETGARLTHLRLQDESPHAFHVGAVRISIAEAAAYDSFSLMLGSALARSEIRARLHGCRAHAALNAAQVLRGTQHADFSTVVAHDAPNGTSRQTVKNVLDGHARGVFQGKIEVARAAQKTDGYQMNQALLLSPHAEIDSKPQLEIFADDVKCSHGATVGELDADQLFFLRSRGIPLAEARGMLVRAFLSEALELVRNDAARALFEHALQAKWQEPAP